MAFDYIYGLSADQYSFYRIPKSLMYGDEFRDLSLQAKLLYGLLLDRMGMSAKNQWIDNENRVYVVYPISEMQEDLNVSILIASNWYPASLVKSKFMKLNYHHIQYVLDMLRSNTTKVRNIKKYILASLFNAPTTIESYYRAEVNHDFPQYAAAK